MKKNGKKILLLTLFLTTVLFFREPQALLAEDCDTIPSTQDRIQDKINCLSSKVTQLSTQSKTLKNQIAQFDTQIRLTTLKIADAESKISLLGGRIDQLEGSLTDLIKAFSGRALETYKMSRFTEGVLFLASAGDLSEAVSRFHYLQKIQEADRNLLTRLQEAQTTYKGEKTDQETLQAELKKQQATLNSQKIAKNSLLTATKNDEAKYQTLLAQANAQLAAFRSFVSGQGGASILTGQTKCDSWGCYYNQRDSQWGNIGMGGSQYSMASYGCLVSSVSMVASHYGKNFKPGDVAVIPSAFVPGTGYLYSDFSVNGINVIVTKSSKSIIDSELSAGRPVIAGLYSGPDHFIVITRKDGDKYIMRDPFLENGAGSDGSGRPLTDKYNFSDITTLRLVSFK